MTRHNHLLLVGGIVAALAVAVMGSGDTMAIRLVVSSAIELGFVAAIAARQLRAADRERR